MQRRFEQRAAGFLAFTQRVIYQRPGNPYRQLLALAGCEAGDLARLVEAEGIEGALAELLRRGVYLTVDEYKGRRPVRRGSATLAVDPALLRNPLVSSHLLAYTSGSRGARTPIPIDFAWLRDRSVNASLLLDARGGGQVAHGQWGTPGGGIGNLRMASVGLRMERWFWTQDPFAADLHPRYRWAYRALRLGCLLGGYPLPRPELATHQDPWPVLHWINQMLAEGRRPNLDSLLSPALRLCQVATAAGHDLRGVRFTVTGEPLTPARLAVFRRAGAEVWLTYGSMDAGGDISAGCLEPAASDDVHLLDDLYALIQAGPVGLPANALFVSTIQPTAPFVLLNVSMGDQAELSRRACGCPLERLGWTTHLQSIRSYEKLTAGGMTFFDTDVVRVLEEVLPARFGGGPLDYQLIEGEGPDGAPQVDLLVDPSVGPIVEQDLVETFLTAIGPGSGAERLMALNWQQAGLLRVQRRAPLATASGKILHLAQEPRPAAAHLPAR